eukprot:TRINITY_DN3697_c1_g1_i1.p1 TRINITY_DN3697_c1_g1~~TRINITY_DN3697_c1_g1_i1.p1  ORF type:complete len:230 (+),score=45.22 TRINITY_DN3697_c1_g1_i1:38-727(+)
MAAGYIAAQCPSIGEYEANEGEVRRQIAELRAKNEKLKTEMKSTLRDNDVQTERAFWARRQTADLVDRAKYIQIASISNPAAIAQYCPNLKGPPPHQFYQEQVAKIRHKTRAQLMAEAARMSGSGGGVAAKTLPPPKSREVPCNFSPGSGTENSIRKQADPILLGLRNLTHWNTNRKPGKLPGLLPRDSEVHAFKEHTSSWMARSGEADPGRNRAHVSMMTNSRSSPNF